MSILRDVNWHEVKYRYAQRKITHEMLLELHELKSLKDFSELLLGISGAYGSYSAREHKRGHLILGSNPRAFERVYDLATDLISLADGHSVPALVKATRLRYLNIAVGSEASCMLNPKHLWVTNIRTIWAHLVIKHDGDFDRANEELKLYRDGDNTSDKAYRNWEAIHQILCQSMTDIALDGARFAKAAGVSPGNFEFLWADAISSWVYDNHH
jgi:hypothetical protein